MSRARKPVALRHSPLIRLTLPRRSTSLRFTPSSAALPRAHKLVALRHSPLPRPRNDRQYPAAASSGNGAPLSQSVLGVVTFFLSNNSVVGVPTLPSSGISAPPLPKCFGCPNSPPLWVSWLFVKRYLCRGAATKAVMRLSLIKMACTPAGWFDPIMKSLATQSKTQLRADVAWAINFIAQTCRRSPQSKSNKDNSLDGILHHLNA